MLVMSRKVGERILIGEEITVTVVKVSGGGVRIGVEAPLELPIMREELAEQIMAAFAGGKAAFAGSKAALAGSKTNLDDRSE